MRHSRVAHTSSLAVLASCFLLVSATSPSNSRPECINQRSQELAARASCGDEGSLNYCFSNLVSVDAATPIEQLTSEIESCFVSAGCTNAEAEIEALWTLRGCDEEPSDLRRRREAAMPLGRDASPFPGLTVIEARQATTTATNPPAAANPTNPANSPTSCFSDTVVQITTCPTQATGTEAGKKLSCFPADATQSVCIEGLICQFDGQGHPSCMFKQSKLPLEGIIIMIVFASAIVVATASICFFCCRERRSQNRLIRAAEAAKIAQEAKTQAMVDSKKQSSRGLGGASPGDGMDRQPLMGQHAGEDLPALPSMPQSYGGGYQQGAPSDYGGSHTQNPFVDSSHPLR